MHCIYASIYIHVCLGLPWWLSGKECFRNVGDTGLIPGLGRSQAWKDLLEKEMATHSSILDLEIPWTQEPARQRSMGLQSQT